MSLGKLRHCEIIFVKGNQPFFRNRNIQIPTLVVFRPAKLSKADWKVSDKVLRVGLNMLLIHLLVIFIKE